MDAPASQIDVDRTLRAELLTRVKPAADRPTAAQLARAEMRRRQALEPEPLFEDTYSPGIVRYFLAHWEELETLASQSDERATVRRATGRRLRNGEPEYADAPIGRGWVSLDGIEWPGGPSRNADLADHMQREYELIRLWWDSQLASTRLTADERRAYCLCSRRDLWRRNLPGGSSGRGEPGKRAARAIADLEYAADGLCLLWPSTQAIFAQQRRLSILEVRRSQAADLAAWLRTMGSDPGYGTCLTRMARDLGWTPKATTRGEAA